MALENSMLVMNGKQVGGNTQDLTGYQTKVDNNLETESKEIVKAINELRNKKTDTDIVAADFNSGTSYTAGNYCIYEGKFYKFKANHSGAWSAADVDEIKIAGELASLKSGLTDVNSNLMYKASVVRCGEISGGAYLTITLSSGHMYMVAVDHPYSEGGMALVASFEYGSAKVTWIKSKSGITVSQDANLVLTITAENTVWYTIVDIGSVY